MSLYTWIRKVSCRKPDMERLWLMFCVVQGRELKKMQLQDERKAESMRECTFKPETNEGKKRQILEEILAAEPPLMY